MVDGLYFDENTDGGPMDFAGRPSKGVGRERCSGEGKEGGADSGTHLSYPSPSFPLFFLFLLSLVSLFSTAGHTEREHRAGGHRRRDGAERGGG